MLLLRSIKKIQTGRWCTEDPTLSLSLRTWVYHPNTRIYVRLLGPCFKTGRLKPFRQHPKGKGSKPTELSHQKHSQHAVYTVGSKGDWVLQDCPANLSLTQSMLWDYNARGLPFSKFFLQVKLMLTRPLNRALIPERTCGIWRPILVSSVSLLTISRTI